MDHASSFSIEKPLAEFNITEAPTEGLYLIEANAGTGKTFSLVSIYLKFLFSNYSASEIIAVTFTRAATRELSIRIKASLEELLFGSLQKINLPPNPQVAFFLTLLENMDEETKSKTLANLKDAVIHLKDHPPQTIDSFMTGLLKDYSFELGQFRERELLEDADPLIDEVYWDFLRTYFSDYLFLSDKDENRYFLHYLLSKENLSSSQNVKSLKDKYLGFLIQPSLILKPEFEFSENSTFLFLNLVEIFGKGFYMLDSFQQLIRRYQLKIESRLANKEFLKLVGSSKRPSTIKNWLEKIILLDLQQYPIDFNPILSFEELIRDTPLKELLAFCHFSDQDNEYLWADIFFNQIKKLSSAITQLNQNLEHNHLVFLHFFIGRMREKIKQRKEELGVFFYSDYTQWIGETLKKEKLFLGGKHRAFLIDEFQDTDPEQYAVFRRIISIQQAQAKSVVAYFIGDPKQSIYRFRQANLETYFMARDSLVTFSLTKNYRTHKRLLKQVNHFFSNENESNVIDKSPFYSQNFVFTPSSAEDSVTKKLEEKYPTALLPPLFYIHRPNHSSDKSEIFTTAELQNYFVNRLVNHLATIQKEAPSFYSTILTNTAILVDSNKEVFDIKELLDAQHIPSVVESQEKIYESKEFLFLKIFLKAVLIPTAKNIYAPFVWLGLTPPEDAVKVFDTYLEIWEQKSFFPFLKEVFDHYFFEAALLKQGERTHTNFFHLVDMMIFLEKKFSTPLALFKKLQRLQPQDFDHFDTSLRYEAGDTAAIKILTIHKSKGLEYDFVHILYPPKKNFINTQAYYLLTQAHTSAGILNFKNLTDLKLLADKEKSIKEEISENFRKLYVALTRAKLQINLYVGHQFLPQEFKIEDNKTGKIIYANPKMPLCSVLKYSFLYSKSLLLIEKNYDINYNKEGVLPFIVKMVQDIEPSSISLDKDLLSTTYHPLEPYVHPTRPRKNSYQTSFTALSSHSQVDVDSMLVGEQVSQTILTKSVDDILHFRGGVATGNFFHALIEQWNFSTDLNHLKEVFFQLIKKYPYFEKYQTVVFNCLERLKEVELFGQFTFNDFHGENGNQFNWLNELEFMLTLKKEDSQLKEELHLYLDSIHHSFYPSIPINLIGEPKLPNRHNLGVVRGFIDLVIQHENCYYIVDWKTNILADYNANTLVQAIKDSHYQLQALIYLVGLERYLKTHLFDYDYDIHMGGVSYVFLRGIADPETHGVIDLTPTKKEFEEFKNLFC